MIQFVPCFVLYWDGDGKVAQLLVFNGESTATVVSGHGKKKKIRSQVKLDSLLWRMSFNVGTGLDKIKMNAPGTQTSGPMSGSRRSIQR